MAIPYWLDPAQTLAPPLSGDVECEVAVIGAGLCGAAATLSLARQGNRTKRRLHPPGNRGALQPCGDGHGSGEGTGGP